MSDHTLRVILLFTFALPLIWFAFFNTIYQLENKVYVNGVTKWKVGLYAFQNVIASAILGVLSQFAFEPGSFPHAFGAVIPGTSMFLSIINCVSFLMNRADQKISS